MAVYVDEINDYSHKSSVGIKALKYGTQWCHLYTADPYDEEQIQELHEMAEQLGLKRIWFQKRRDFPHYDLTPSKRKLALEKGAIDDSDHKIMRNHFVIKKQRAKKVLDDLVKKYGDGT